MLFVIISSMVVLYSVVSWMPVKCSIELISGVFFKTHTVPSTPIDSQVTLLLVCNTICLCEMGSFYLKIF